MMDLRIRVIHRLRRNLYRSNHHNTNHKSRNHCHQWGRGIELRNLYRMIYMRRISRINQEVLRNKYNMMMNLNHITVNPKSNQFLPHQFQL